MCVYLRGTGNQFIVCFWISTIPGASLSTLNQEFSMWFMWKWQGRWRLRRKEVNLAPRRRKDEKWDMSPIKTPKRNRSRWLETKSEQERNCHASLHRMPWYEAKLMETRQGTASRLVVYDRHPLWLAVAPVLPIPNSGGFKLAEFFCGSHEMGNRTKTNLAHRWDRVYFV